MLNDKDIEKLSTIWKKDLLGVKEDVHGLKEDMLFMRSELNSLKGKVFSIDEKIDSLEGKIPTMIEEGIEPLRESIQEFAVGFNKEITEHKNWIKELSDKSGIKLNLK